MADLKVRAAVEAGEFAAEVHRRRETLGLSANEAARRAGITGQRWLQIERGYELRQGYKIPANPTRRTAVKMAQAIDWPVAEALQAAGFDLPATTEPLSGEDTDFPLDDWQRLTSAQQHALRALITTMIDRP